jgi:hypothetical protein
MLPAVTVKYYCNCLLLIGLDLEARAPNMTMHLSAHAQRQYITPSPRACVEPA